MLEASAKLGGNGGFVIIGYHVNEQMALSKRGTALYIIDQASKKKLDVQSVPILGPLFSHPMSRTPVNKGFFLIDNGERLVRPGSKITVFVGDLKQEDIVVIE